MKKILFFVSVLALCAVLIGVTDSYAQRNSSRMQRDERSTTVNHSSKNQWKGGRRITVTPKSRIVTREIHVRGDIHEIDLHGIADVEYRQSRNGETRVEVRGNENLLEYLSVSNSRGVLNIESRRNLQIKGKYSLTVLVTSSGVNRLSASGAGDIRILGQLESNELEIISRGASDIKFDRINADKLSVVTSGASDVDGNTIDVKSLNITVSGSSDVDISKVSAVNVGITISGSGDVEIENGRARDAVFKVAGTGDMDAYGLRAENVTATVSGTGDITCYASSSLRASVSGIGTITVGGNPDNVDIRGNKRSVRFR